MPRIPPCLRLMLIATLSAAALAKEQPSQPWKTQIRPGVEAWDAGRTEEAEKALAIALAGAEKAGRNALQDPDLALPYQILSYACETRDRKAEAEKHFQKAREVLKASWTGRGPAVLRDLRERADSKGARFQYGEQVSLGRLVMEVLEDRSPRSSEALEATLNHAGALQDAGQLVEADRQFRRTLSLAEKLRHPELGVCLNNFALCCCDRGCYREALALFQRALAESERSHGGDESRAGPILKNLAGVWVRLGEEANAEAALQRAMPILERARDAEWLQMALLTWGDLRRRQARFDDAEAFYQRALDVKGAPKALQALAALSQERGRLQEAERHARGSVSEFERTLGSEHFSTASARSRLGAILKAQGKHEEAEALCREALEVQERVLGCLHPDTAETQDVLGMLLYEHSRYPEAEKLFRQVLAGRTRAFGEEHPGVPAILGRQGDLYMAMGRPKDAEAPYRRALALDEKRLGAGHAGVASRCHYLGECLAAQRQHAAAEAMSARALAIDEKAFGADHPAVMRDLDALLGLYRILGKAQQVEAMESRTRAIRAKASAELAEAMPPAPAPPVPAPSGEGRPAEPEVRKPAEAPKPQETVQPVPATPEGYGEALRRGMGYLEEARRALGTDFDAKRRAYAAAEVAFRQALGALAEMKRAGTAPDRLDIGEQDVRLASLLYECRKCKPMDVR